MILSVSLKVAKDIGDFLKRVFLFFFVLLRRIPLASSLSIIFFEVFDCT